MTSLYCHYTVCPNREFALASQLSTQKPGRLEEKYGVRHNLLSIWLPSVLSTQFSTREKCILSLGGECIGMSYTIEKHLNSSIK